MDQLSTQILSIGIPALVSVAAAIYAGSSARKVKITELESARLRELEARTAEKKFAMYQPMLQALGDLLTPSRQAAAVVRLEDVMADFQTFVTIWGSDDAIVAFYRYRLGAQANPPATISIRLVADFIIAIRKDLAWPDTKITALETMGGRITDLQAHPEMKEAFSMPMDQLAAKNGWTVPW